MRKLRANQPDGAANPQRPWLVINIHQNSSTFIKIIQNSSRSVKIHRKVFCFLINLSHLLVGCEAKARSGSRQGGAERSRGPAEGPLSGGHSKVLQTYSYDNIMYI